MAKAHPSTDGARLILWIAQGLGIGRAPFAPGTFGTLLGFAWFWLLLRPGSGLFFIAAMLASFPAAAWLCGRAEKITGLHDPGSVVLDEIVAVPLAATPLWLLPWWNGAFPRPEALFGSPRWPDLVAAFILFRIFDVAKPWPIRQSQSVPGGWGVVVDDLLAALYAGALLFPVARWLHTFQH